MAAKKSFKREIIEWVVTIVIALGIAWSIRLFVIQPFRVQMSSMYPTLHNDDLILINKLSFVGAEPTRGDIIVFTPPNHSEGDGIEYIKRIIGLPGEYVEIESGTVYINGHKLEENDDHTKTNYNQHFKIESDKDKKGVLLGPDEFYVMGDNRGGSLDSRTFGPIKRDSILGRAFVVFWPVIRLQVLQ
ncbi:MAG: signal peptidase I [Caldisericales bacterium]|nr:signal peptidase I [Caldisericales bacterium]